MTRMRFLTHSVVMPTGVTRPTKDTESVWVSTLTEPIVSLRSRDDIIPPTMLISSTLDVVNNQEGFKGFSAASALASVSRQGFFSDFASGFAYGCLKFARICGLHLTNIFFKVIVTNFTKDFSFSGFTFTFTFGAATRGLMNFVNKFFSGFLFHKYSVSWKIL